MVRLPKPQTAKKKDSLDSRTACIWPNEQKTQGSATADRALRSFWRVAFTALADFSLD